MTRAPIVLALALSLAACGGDKKQQGAGTAEGEVLPGSASDAMLPLDTVTSQPPLAPKAQSEGKDAAPKAAPKDAPAAPDAPTAAPAPAAAEELPASQ